jgi:hypothetical protein
MPGIETAKSIDPQIPLKPWDELKKMHGGAVMNSGIFRTELPGEQLPDSITYAEVITGERFHAWNVRKEDGGIVLALIQRLYASHTHPLTLNKKQVENIVTSLENLRLVPK